VNLPLFLPCAAGVEELLAPEVLAITQRPASALIRQRGGVRLAGSWRDVLLLNLHCRLAQRVLIELSHTEYRHEQDLYRAAFAVAWEVWFTPKQSIKVEVTAQHSPLTSLNFAALKIKDAVCDRFRETAGGVRPDVNTQWPDVRLYAHLTTDTCTLYIDTSGEPLFKRGWREDTGDAPLKETLAAAMIAASGWAHGQDGVLLPLYDPCCGSGTLAIEAAQIACHIAPGSLRHFSFETYIPFQPHVWQAIKNEAQDQVVKPNAGEKPLIYGSDVSHRMADFAMRNAQRAGVADVIEFRGGDALQRMPPVDVSRTGGGVMLLNPPYGERIGVSGVAASAVHTPPAQRFGARELPETTQGGEFFTLLASHWKKNYAGWTAWVLTPDLKLPGKMRLKESRKVPMWNGPIECRLFKFSMVKGSMKNPLDVDKGRSDETRLKGEIGKAGEMGSDHRQHR
jgi:putative N6-adenine-specific DNA methylase